jgi:thiamine kinase-like enzyme
MSAADASDLARVEAVIARVPGWNGRAHAVGALGGGATNHNHVVEVAGARFVVRLPGRDTELLEIDRSCEQVAATRAARLGIAPEVVGLFDGCLVTRFVAGAAVGPAECGEPETLDAIAGILRSFHASGPLDHDFDAFTVPRLHRAAAASRGVAIPPAYERVIPIVEEIARCFEAAPDRRVPCHNDLLCANLLRDERRLWLLDWEYAGMNDRAFDLGNLAVNNDLSPEAEEHLVGAYHGTLTPRAIARLRLMKLASDAREAMWAVVQQGISTIDFDYAALADRMFDRFLTNATTASYRDWLDDAAVPEATA